jgi:DNA sulfur modification protein DndB
MDTPAQDISMSPVETTLEDPPVSLQLANRKDSGPIVRDFQTFEDARLAASEEATATQSIMSPAMLYRQGGRHFIITTFSFQTLIRHVRYDSAKKGDDPDEHVNRPFMPQHSKELSAYLQRTADYILPPLALNTQDPLTFYTLRTPSHVRMGYIVIPASLEFGVTDGQHRGNAVAETIRTRKDLGQDGIGVIISTESDVKKIHQDFVDCAKNKPIPPAMLAAFDHANLVVRYVNDTVKAVKFLDGRVDRSSAKLGKNTVKVFTLNQVQTALLEFLVGRVPAKAQIPKVGEERLKDEMKMAEHVADASKFLNEFTQSNSQWRKVAAKVPGAGGSDDTYDLRQKMIHFSATGLAIIGKVGHVIYSNPDSRERTRLTSLLAQIDWSRTNPVWQGNIMSGEKMMNSRGALDDAANLLKGQLGLNDA